MFHLKIGYKVKTTLNLKAEHTWYNENNQRIFKSMLKSASSGDYPRAGTQNQQFTN